jgi:GT2 family glycosyltransferase
MPARFMSNPQLVAEERVAIVMVNWNGWRECIECIDSLFAQSHENFHVFVVDNASTDLSVEHIVSWCAAPVADPVWRRHPGVRRLTDESGPGALENRVMEFSGQLLPAAPERCRLTIVRSGANLGFAGGCNVGINAAGLESFDYFWFLNPDTVVHQDALVELLRRAARHRNVGMVGSTIRYYDKPDVVQAMGGARLNRSNGRSVHIGQGASVHDIPVDESAVERDMTYVMGASMLVTTQFIAEVGLMEEDYFLYFEEIDWVFRANGRFALGYAPLSQIFHKSGANSSKAQPLYTSGFYYRNRLRFVARFLPDRLTAAKWALFEELLRHCARGRGAHARLVISTLMMADRIAADATRRR